MANLILLKIKGKTLAEIETFLSYLERGYAVVPTSVKQFDRTSGYYFMTVTIAASRDPLAE